MRDTTASRSLNVPCRVNNNGMIVLPRLKRNQLTDQRSRLMLLFHARPFPQRSRVTGTRLSDLTDDDQLNREWAELQPANESKTLLRRQERADGSDNNTQSASGEKSNRKYINVILLI